MSDEYRSVFRASLFEDRLVMVTGGGSGIGRCIAHELAHLGAHVALTGRRIERLDDVKAEIEGLGGSASTHAFDIRDEDAATAAVDEIAVIAPITGLVNNAGGQYPSPVEDLSLKGWETVIRNNLTGGFIVSRAVYKRSMADHGGSIVNIIADIWNGMPTMAHSGAARAGMLNFTETAACEWARSGVRVNAVAPGWISSSGFDTYDADMQEQLRRLKHEVPLGRYGTEAEVSAAVVFLLSPAAAFVSGSCIRVDGAVPNHRHTWTLATPERYEPYEGFPLASQPECLKD